MERMTFRDGEALAQYLQSRLLDPAPPAEILQMEGLNSRMSPRERRKSGNAFALYFNYRLHTLTPKI